MHTTVTLEELISLFLCPCQAPTEKLERFQTHLKCHECQSVYPIEIKDSTPKLFTTSSTFDSGLSGDAQSKFGQSKWTPWRIENQKFIKENILGPQGIVIDIGSGPGIFNNLYQSQRILTVDFTNYPQTNLVCDITNSLPVKSNLVNLVILTNTLEHIPEPEKLLRSLNRILIMNGKIIVTIPFLLGVHQEPYDFYRFTPYALEILSRNSGFIIEKIEASGDIGTFETLSRHFFQFRIARKSRFARFFWQLQKLIVWACKLSLESEKRMDYCGGYMLVLCKKRELGALA